MHACQYCGAPLSAKKRRHALYCGLRCRVAAYRARDPRLLCRLQVKMVRRYRVELQKEIKAATGRRLVDGPPLAGEAKACFWRIAQYGIALRYNEAHRDPVEVAKGGRYILSVLEALKRSQGGILK